MFTGEVCADRSQRTIRVASLSGFLLTAVSLALVLTTSAFGQATEGTILGAVVDPSRAAVSNATVTITNVETGAVRTTTTNSDGEYVVTNLPPGLLHRRGGSSGI